MNGLDDKIKGLLSYLFGFIGGIVFLFVVKDSSKTVKIHAAQSIVISIGYIVLSMAIGILTAIISIPFVRSAPYIVYVLATIFGMVKAYQEQDPALPVINDMAMSLFKKQIEEEPVKTAEKAENKEEPKK